MKKNKSLFVLLALCFSAIWADAQVSLSFEESLRLLRQENQSLKIADKSIEIAKAERDKLNAFWYPSLQSSGAFVHMSEKIEVKQPLSQFTDPAKNFVHSIIPDDQVISAILDQIGANTLVFPLTPRNLTSIDLSAEWVLFSGGKRFHATNIGRTMVDLARENRAQTAATQQNLLTESYYGLRLAQQIVTVREETYKGLQKHYENALKLEAAGMTQSMSRVAKCIDNGPMEGFWGIIKRERYYGKRFTSRTALVGMIESYMEYYNNRRLQRNLGVLTPMEKHEQYILAA